MSGREAGGLALFGRALLETLFPEGGCAICGGELPEARPEWWELEVCPRCLGDVFAGEGAGATGKALAALSSPAAAFLDGVVVGGGYGGALEKAVLRLKTTPDRRLARFLARLLAERLEEAAEPAVAAWDFLVPVPLHRGRLRERGFNQASLVARELAARLGRREVQETVTERVRPTPLQSTLSPAERMVNVTGAFSLRAEGREMVRGARVLVVDDVLTTGATTGELARVLKSGGAAAVWGVAVAQAR